MYLIFSCYLATYLLRVPTLVGMHMLIFFIANASLLVTEHGSLSKYKCIILYNF